MVNSWSISGNSCKKKSVSSVSSVLIRCSIKICVHLCYLWENIRVQEINLCLSVLSVGNYPLLKIIHVILVICGRVVRVVRCCEVLCSYVNFI